MFGIAVNFVGQSLMQFGSQFSNLVPDAWSDEQHRKHLWLPHRQAKAGQGVRAAISEQHDA